MYVTHHHLLASMFAGIVQAVGNPISGGTKSCIALVTIIACMAVGFGASLIEEKYLALLDRLVGRLLVPVDASDMEMKLVAEQPNDIEDQE
jgi:hypothetical protein